MGVETDGWQARYYGLQDFDEVGWGSHCVDCYPGNCTYRVFVKDGKITREEIAGPNRELPECDVPDEFPSGCNKGAAWSAQLDAQDRVLWPLRRVGERGSGAWERITWQEALDEIADALLDTIEEHGTDRILREGSPQIGTGLGADRFIQLVGGIQTDLNGAINDYAAGFQMTFGKPNQLFRPVDIFHADTIIGWHINPAYTLIPIFHYMAEARYRGAKIIHISPDVSPSHTHTDLHVPIEWGADPALALAMCQVIVEEGLVDEDFVRTQTDLSLLVRSDTGRFLRASDLPAGGRDDQFFHLDPAQGVVQADRANLLCDYEPALEGSAEVELRDGSTESVMPLYVRLKHQLAEYTPEAVTGKTGVHPETIREIARMCATGRTMIAVGGSASKTYHADLFQRCTHLILALTGNWGKKGTGTGWWNVTHGDGLLMTAAKPKAGPEGTEMVLSMLEMVEQSLMANDPSLTEELASFTMARSGLAARGMVPPFFFWYWHCGYRDRLNNASWGDPTLARTYDEYVQEALDAGWWNAVRHPAPDRPPKVLIECGGNIMRRTRGGKELLLENLWPKLDLIVTVDFRLSVTALHSDIVLPAAQHYEKVAAHMPSMEFVIGDKIVEPAGESMAEWEIFADLCRAIAGRAEARGLTEFTTPDGVTRSYSDLWNLFTYNQHLCTTESVIDEMIRDAAYAGILPEGTDLAKVRETGRASFIAWGRTPLGRGEATPWPEDGKNFTAFRNHVEEGYPYPTLTHRAQFLIEHPWFVEAGEDLPVHKDPPPMGGDLPYFLTTGHNRWSIHAMNMANPWLLGTHRGEPHAVLSTEDAAREGISDHDPVEISNGAGSLTVRAKLSPAQKPGGVTVYAGWDGYMFKDWGVPADLEPGLIKHLGLVNDYGHLRYSPLEWQPVPCDRPVRVAIRKAG